jgi:hypothetical protein
MDFEECLSSFIDDISYALKIFLDRLTIIEVESVAPPEEVKRDLLSLTSNDLFQDLDRFYIIKINCCFDYNPGEITVTSSDGSLHVIEDLGPYIACDLASDIKDILILTSIAMPSRLSIGRGRVYYNENGYNEIDPLPGISAEYTFDENTKWPPLIKIPLPIVVDWEKRLGLFASGIAKTPIQRGLASLTHIIGSESNEGGELLFLAMQGLESIYCTGKSELRGQLSEKSRVLLGPWDDSKNIVGSLYDLRSKFVHGSHNLVRWHNNLEIDDVDWKTEEKLFEATSLAVRLLIATIQRCIQLNCLDLQFTYVLRS